MTEEENKSDLNDSLIIRKMMTETKTDANVVPMRDENETGDILSTPLRIPRNTEMHLNTAEESKNQESSGKKQRSSSKVPPLDLKGAGL